MGSEQAWLRQEPLTSFLPLRGNSVLAVEVNFVQQLSTNVSRITLPYYVSVAASSHFLTRLVSDFSKTVYLPGCRGTSETQFERVSLPVTGGDANSRNTLKTL